MRMLPLFTLYAVGTALMPIDGCSGCPDTATPTTGGTPIVRVVQAELDTSPRSLAYTYQHSTRGRVLETIELTLDVAARGLTTVDVAGQLTSASLTSTGLVPSGSDPVPVYLDMLSVGPRAGVLAVGGSTTFRVPSDAELDDDTVTVQSEVTVTLLQTSGPLAIYDFDARYRVVDNQALDDLRTGLGRDQAVDAILDGALEWRLSTFGEVRFDLDAGVLLDASVTSAGLPLAELDRASLDAHDDAFSYTLSLTP